MPQYQNQQKVRNSSIELLRIIAMIMIVFHHFSYHGGFAFEAAVSIPHFWYNFIIMGGKIGVNIFVMISGYHLIMNDQKVFDIYKTIKYVGQVLFYSVGIFFICVLLGITEWGFRAFTRDLFPLIYSQWWFASTYFVLYLLHPFINKLLLHLDKTLYQKLLFLLILFWSIIPTFSKSLFQGNSLLWFVTLYSISGYIRLHGLNRKFTNKHYSTFCLVISLLTYGSSIAFTVLGNRWGFFARHIRYFYDQEKLPVLLISVSLFMTFATLKMNYHKWINTVASATFGVYLLHDNHIIREFLWTDLFQNAQYQDSLFLIPYSVIVVAIVFVSCSVIELLRQHIIEKPFMVLVKRYSEKIFAPFKKVMIILSDFIFGKSVCD